VLYNEVSDHEASGGDNFARHRVRSTNVEGDGGGCVVELAGMATVSAAVVHCKELKPSAHGLVGIRRID
jgi:hypothetical protein